MKLFSLNERFYGRNITKKSPKQNICNTMATTLGFKEVGQPRPEAGAGEAEAGQQQSNDEVVCASKSKGLAVSIAGTDVPRCQSRSPQIWGHFSRLELLQL